MTRVLSREDREALGQSLRADGYAVVPAIVAPDMLAVLNRQLIEAYESAERFRGGGSIRGHINCFPGEDARFAFAQVEEAGIADLIRSLRDGRNNDVRVTLNYNLPGSVAQHYHMDGVYLNEFMICNIAVVDTDLNNGAIDLLPGTHLRFYPFWRYAVERKYRLTTRVPMNRGDVLLRLSTLWHRGTPNRTTAPRPMLSFTFGEESAPSRDLFSGGGIRFYPNWYSNSTRFGVLQERIEVAAPITRSLWRCAKSFTGKRGYASD
jgi:hypothetical protein